MTHKFLKFHCNKGTGLVSLDLVSGILRQDIYKTTYNHRIKIDEKTILLLHDDKKTLTIKHIDESLETIEAKIKKLGGQIA